MNNTGVNGLLAHLETRDVSTLAPSHSRPLANAAVHERTA
jgi:hypothetical protein